MQLCQYIADYESGANSMKVTVVTSALFATVIGFASSAAFADHNGAKGAGWANMPNDIHNARIEGTTADGTEITDWSAFVSKGAGADTVNRYDDDLDVRSVTSMRPATSGSFDRPTVASRGGRR